MDHIEAVVIGAGVVGLAVARELALSGREVLILEAESAIGTGTSSRNSGVIHAGIYYKQGSLKARACVEGKKLLYAYVRERGVAHKNCGKLIVAVDDKQVGVLNDIRARAAANGVHDLEVLSGEDVKRREPHLRAAGGLWSPSTGIIDVHELMLAYLGDAENAGAMLALNAPVETISRIGTRFIVSTGETEISCDILVNAAGLSAQIIARKIAGFDAALVPRQILAKGNYFSLSGSQPFKTLVYPVPEPGGLGVHATLDLQGRVRFGPDVEWLEGADIRSLDYAVNPARAARFYKAIRHYWPGLPDGALQPDYSGVRPKIDAGGAEGDFILQGPAQHGVKGLVNMFGIESPGLTSSLALAAMVANALKTN